MWALLWLIIYKIEKVSYLFFSAESNAIQNDDMVNVMDLPWIIFLILFTIYVVFFRN